MQTSCNWNGDDVILAKSKGGVLAFTEPLEGLLRGDVEVWPAPEILQKLYKSNHEAKYEGEDLSAVVRTMGYYCDLQSINSEDAITWSVFGPLIYAEEATRIKFCTNLFHMIEPSLCPPQVATISLWRRTPHPTKLSMGGPEIDVLLQTPAAVILGEAKWKSPTDEEQIELRKMVFSRFGQRIYAAGTTFIVLGIYLDKPLFQRQECRVGDVEILMRSVSWEDLCSINPHPAGDELPRYFRWKKKISNAGKMRNQTPTDI
ncbi:MAG: hypothetical protein OXK78_15735 [Caldilineaceae bacterium]|nr:hypothetical protein [Caldilineaceae bacterium]